MALRTIRVNDDPILRKISKDVKKITPRTIELIDDMLETMYEAQGVGLAAVQVGVLRRVVVIDVGDGPIELINPVITKRSEEEYLEAEGCLSVPDKQGYVFRPTRVTVEALNRDGEKFSVDSGDDEFLSKAICHELDHLEGILYTDKTIDPTEEQLKEILANREAANAEMEEDIEE